MIELQNVTFSYPNSNKNALEDINIKIKDGSWVSIIGHNGSGKSTLAKILVGLLESKSGQITIDNEPFEYNEKSSYEIRKKIGIVFQNPDNQFVGVTVRNDIAFGLENRLVEREIMNEKVDEALQKINMKKYEDREPYQLSGGQKQKVAIGSVLACDLKYIIFDEATSMLDPEGSREIIKLIEDLKTKENKTVITITHDLSLAAKSDYIYVLNKGKVSYHGEPKDVLNQTKILEESNLEAPLALKLLQEVKENKSLKNNQELQKILWELSSMM